MSEIQKRLEVAVAAAREAAEVILGSFRREDLVVDLKSDLSPVTIADRDAEVMLREKIARAFPADGVIGEEFGETSGTSGFCWTLDPIDGTKSFVAGVPLFTTLIGILENDASRAGVIHAPATGETIYGSIGGGAWYHERDKPPRSARVSSVDQIEDALFVTSEVKSFTKYRERDAVPLFVELQRRARLTRTWGDGYGYLLVATGRADIAIDPAMNIWDAAPLLPILQEAGGRLTDWRGADEIDAGEAIGTNGKLHDAVVKMTRNW